MSVCVLMSAHPTLSKEYKTVVDIYAARRESMCEERLWKQEADALTHPGGNLKLPYRTTRDLADAEPILAEYSRRLFDWVTAKFPETSSESRFLSVMQSMCLLLKAGPAHEDTEMEHWKKVLDLARVAMRLRLEIHTFSLSLQVGEVQYDTADAVHCVHAAAMSTMLRMYTCV